MLLRDHPEKPVPQGELPPSATYGEGFIGYEAERQQVRFKFEVQEALNDLGYDTGGIDGSLGPATRKAIRAFQAAEGLPADGKPSQELLARMREVAVREGRARPSAP
jgi:hypothetical protein